MLGEERSPLVRPHRSEGHRQQPPDNGNTKGTWAGPWGADLPSNLPHTERSTWEGDCTGHTCFSDENTILRNRGIRACPSPPPCSCGESGKSPLNTASKSSPSLPAGPPSLPHCVGSGRLAPPPAPCMARISAAHTARSGAHAAGAAYGTAGPGATLLCFKRGRCPALPP